MSIVSNISFYDCYYHIVLIVHRVLKFSAVEYALSWGKNRDERGHVGEFKSGACSELHLYEG